MNQSKELNIKLVTTRTEDKSSLKLYIQDNGYQELTIAVTDEVRDFVDESELFDYGENEILLATFDPSDCLLTTFPTNLQPGNPYFGVKKYLSVRRISFENAKPIIEELDDDGRYRLHFRQFPSGFASNFFDGFGLIYPLRFIIEAIEEFTDVDEIRMCADGDASINSHVFRLPINLYDLARKTVDRTHRAAVAFANEEKRIYLRSELVLPHIQGDGGKSTFRRTTGDLKVILGSAIRATGRKSASRTSNESAAVRLVRSAAKELINDQPNEIYELNRQIELVTLEDVIAKFEEKLNNVSLTETSWQRFFSNNPFILRLAFGLPAIIFREQMPVGGWDVDNKGGKLADFVMKSGALGNLTIVEIKRPSSVLLSNNPYRGGVYAPSVSISGAVTQVIDQRYLLQKHLTILLGSSQNTTAASYAVQCIVIAGITPTELDKQKSFELYRNNLSSVVVITFDELLAKLKALHEFLLEHPRTETLEEDELRYYDDNENLEDEADR
ncbi:Shedu immune nuclease family protein [Brucella sp. TWI559]